MGREAQMKHSLLSSKNILVSLMSVSATFLSLQANASGYALREMGPSLMGNAYAGISTSDEDISAIAFNPATLAMMEGNQVYIAGSGIFPSITANNAQGHITWNGGNFPVTGQQDVSGVGKDAFVPAAFFGLDVNEQVKLGLAITSPFGLATTYPDNWAGRNFGVYTRLSSLNIAPMASFSFNKHFSIAAGFQAQYLDAKLKQATTLPNLGDGGATIFDIDSQLEGYGWGYGYTLGGLYEFTESTRIGIGFQSKIDTTLTGTASATSSIIPGGGIPGTGPSETHITTPENINFGFSHDINRHWTVMADAQWTRWSRFDELQIDIDSHDGVSTTTVQEQWKNSWFYALGATFRPDKKWTFRGGVNWDESPVETQFRNPTVPDSDRFMLAAGIGYNFNPCVRVDLGYSIIFFRDAEVDLDDIPEAGDATKSMSADYEGHANLVALGLSWVF